MAIRIVTDSTCDLPDAAIEEHDITVVPQYLNFGEQSYLDKVELSREDFYAKLQKSDLPVTTAAPGPDVFRQSYEQLAEQGASEILSIHVSDSLSATLNGARLGAEQFQSVNVTVFDSRQLSFGLGFLVLTAAKAAQAGEGLAQILTTLSEQIKRTHVFAALDTLEYLRRSGRMSRTIAGLGSMLKVKPILKMFDGEPTSERIRTRERATQRLLELVGALPQLEKAAMLHSNSPERVQELAQRMKSLLPDNKIPTVDITPVIGAHIGPGAVGIACVASQAQ